MHTLTFESPPVQSLTHPLVTLLTSSTVDNHTYPQIKYEHKIKDYHVVEESFTYKAGNRKITNKQE